MPNIDPLTYIKTMLAKDFAEKKKPTATAPSPLLITLSRDEGALGEVIAQQLGVRLNIPVYGDDILDRVAAHAQADAGHTHTGGVSAFLYGLLNGHAASTHEYRRHLSAILDQLSDRDCIILGSGAHLALAGPRLFRVRIVGSLAVCAERIAAARQISLDEAERHVRATNHAQRQSLLELYGERIERCSPEHADVFDLVINTDCIAVGLACELILTALRGLAYLGNASGSRP